MVVEIFIGDCFKRDFKRLSKKYRSLIDDYEIFIDSLKRDPNQGVDLGNGIRKLRMCISSKRKGKSGGARVITLNVLYNCEPEDIMNITLLTIYDKSEINNVSDQFIKSLVEQL